MNDYERLMLIRESKRIDKIIHENDCNLNEWMTGKDCNLNEWNDLFLLSLRIATGEGSVDSSASRFSLGMNDMARWARQSQKSRQSLGSKLLCWIFVSLIMIETTFFPYYCVKLLLVIPDSWSLIITHSLQLLAIIPYRIPIVYPSSSKLHLWSP